MSDDMRKAVVALEAQGIEPWEVRAKIAQGRLDLTKVERQWLQALMSQGLPTTPSPAP